MDGVVCVPGVSPAAQAAAAAPLTVSVHTVNPLASLHTVAEKSPSGEHTTVTMLQHHSYQQQPLDLSTKSRHEDSSRAPSDLTVYPQEHFSLTPLNLKISSTNLPDRRNSESPDSLESSSCSVSPRQDESMMMTSDDSFSDDNTDSSVTSHPTKKWMVDYLRGQSSSPSFSPRLPYPHLIDVTNLAHRIEMLKRSGQMASHVP